MLLLLLACLGLDDKADDTGLEGPDDTAVDDTAVDDTDDPPDPAGDRETFQRVLDGELSADDALAAVALSGGWPIDLGSGQWLFVALDQGEVSLSLAGDFNGWTPEPMTREAGMWWVEVGVPRPEGSQYKFTDGADYTADPWARAYRYDDFGEISLVRGDGEHIERWPGLRDGGLAARTVRVWVPSGPVTHHLYVQDGQNLFDPDAIWGGWRLQESLGTTTLAVGIDNTAARMDEYTHVPDVLQGTEVGGDADAYAALVLDVVRPLVEQRYGTPARVGVMGSSLGGLVSLHMALSDPGDYDFAASLSGTLGWGSIGARNETMIERYADAGFNGVSLYLDSGGGPGSGCVDSDGDGVEDDSPEATDNYCENRQMADTLAGVGWTWDQDLRHWWEPGAPHNEAAWADRVFRPVAIFEGL